jgi:CRP/FNR family cyclic AMP-dependent transcriptional regulator
MAIRSVFRDRWATGDQPRRSPFAAPRVGGQIASLLDVDPEFARRLPRADAELARRHLMVAVEHVPKGRWAPAPPGGRRAPLGCVVLAGSLLRTARVEQRCATELLGREDVLRPWDVLDGPGGLACGEDWTALEPVRVAVLDARFAAVAAHWPPLLDELLARTVRRSRRLVALMSVAGIRRLDVRLLVLLRILADRCGTVSPAGIRVDVRLTHETLARLAGAQRPGSSPPPCLRCSPSSRCAG